MMSFSGLGGLFGSYIGGIEMKNRFKEAIGELRRVQQRAQETQDNFKAKGNEAYANSIKQLTNPMMSADVRQIREFLTTNVTSGLSPFAKLQFDDLNRELEGRAAATGNLRSGAVGIQRAELGRRIASDEFSRALDTIKTFQAYDVGTSGMFMQQGLGYAQAENQALGIASNNASNVAQGLMGLGAVARAQGQTLGTAVGALSEYAVAAMTAGAGGAGGLAAGGGGAAAGGFGSWTGIARAAAGVGNDN